MAKNGSSSYQDDVGTEAQIGDEEASPYGEVLSGETKTDEFPEAKPIVASETDMLIDVKRYGLAKPRRVVIRGTLAHD